MLNLANKIPIPELKRQEFNLNLFQFYEVFIEMKKKFKDIGIISIYKLINNFFNKYHIEI